MKFLFLSGRCQWCSPNNTPKTRQHPLQKFENMHNNWPKTLKKKIPSFLSGDDEPKAQNKNSVCGLSLRALVLPLPRASLLRQSRVKSTLTLPRQKRERTGRIRTLWLRHQLCPAPAPGVGLGIPHAGKRRRKLCSHPA